MVGQGLARGLGMEGLMTFMAGLVLLNGGLRCLGQCIYMTRQSSLCQRAGDGAIKPSQMNEGLDTYLMMIRAIGAIAPSIITGPVKLESAIRVWHRPIALRKDMS